LIDAAIIADRRSVAKQLGSEHVAFCDPSGGVSDSMTLAVSHQESGGIVVLDRLEVAKPPFQPEEVVQRFADILSSYGLSAVTGDRYGGQWVSTMFLKFGIAYRSSELDKSAIYLAAQPLFSQRIVELLDVPKLAGELRRLERRPRTAGGIWSTIPGARTMIWRTPAREHWCSRASWHGRAARRISRIDPIYTAAAPITIRGRGMRSAAASARSRWLMAGAGAW